MGVTLDKPNENDEIFSRDGFDVVIDREILKTMTGVHIQFLPNRWIGSELRVTPI